MVACALAITSNSMLNVYEDEGGGIKVFTSFYSSRYLCTLGIQAFKCPNAMPKSKGIERYHVQKQTRSTRSCSPPIALLLHGSNDLLEASNVGTGDQRRELALSGCDVLLGRLEAVLEALLHDALELLVDFLRRP
jgi:hypothetical protein